MTNMTRWTPDPTFSASPRDGAGASAEIDVDTEAGDPRFVPHGGGSRGLRVHRTRLRGGDASSDSYRFP